MQKHEGQRTAGAQHEKNLFVQYVNGSKCDKVWHVAIVHANISVGAGVHRSTD